MQLLKLTTLFFMSWDSLKLRRKFGQTNSFSINVCQLKSKLAIIISQIFFIHCIMPGRGPVISEFVIARNDSIRNTVFASHSTKYIGVISIKVGTFHMESKIIDEKRTVNENQHAEKHFRRTNHLYARFQIEATPGTSYPKFYFLPFFYFHTM